MDRPYKICFLAYGILYEMVREVIDAGEYGDAEILLLNCNVETLQKAVEGAAAEACEVFIAGAANAAEFARHFHEPLIEIQLGSLDYLIAIRKALRIGERPAVATYRFGRAPDWKLLEELSGVPLEVLSYEDSADLYRGIAESRADVIIGASHAVEIADELRRKNVLVYFSENSIRGALRRARALAAELRKNARKNRITQAIVEHAPFGLVVSDERGRILIFNQALRRVAGLEGVPLRGKPLSDVIPAISPEGFLSGEARQTDQRRLINGAMLRAIQTRIEDDPPQGASYRRQTLGVLTTLFPDNVRRGRRNAEDEGFRARGRWKDAIGKSQTLHSVIRQAMALADQPHPLVIEGEPSVGKNFFAQCIHNYSLRAKEPYIAINMAALPDQDAPRILFGSGGGDGHAGLFELAREGTVVLQNLQAASQMVQSCLLQVLTERQFLRLGTTLPLEFRARLVAVLSRGASRSKVMEELWYRLSVFRLFVPPLHERAEDVAPLFSHFAAQESGMAFRRLGVEFKEILQFYSWPGNLAELLSVCKRFAFLLRRLESPSLSARQNLLIQAIGENALLEDIFRQFPALSAPSEGKIAEVFAGVERMKHILKYNNDQVAEKLSLSRTTLWRLKKEWQNLSSSETLRVPKGTGL